MPDCVILTLVPANNVRSPDLYVPSAVPRNLVTVLVSVDETVKALPSLVTVVTPPPINDISPLTNVSLVLRALKRVAVYPGPFVS